MPRRYNSKETIELILSASIKLFNEKGFDKTSMQEIVDESGVSKGSIFHHFNSKEEILTAVMVNQAKTYEQVILKWLGEVESMTAKEKMIAMLDKILEDADMGADALGKHVLKSPQMILAAMQESLKIAAPIYAQIFKEGTEDGSITTAYPEECAQVFTLLMNFWCDNAIFECSTKELCNRAVFFQQMMRDLGADVISDKHISQFIKSK
ncbi:MAG: TetR/AcrR family transcriptional regulator [Oscillospiraceae bacterium]|nr:TetR/AcrR family transcriptional regulator [Oscillospiraceae bacterium]